MSNDLEILSLRGGMNNTTPPHLLGDTQCVLMENVELFFTGMGERRNGCVAVSLTASGLDGEAIICHLSQHFPTNDVTVAELWAVGVTSGASTTVARLSNNTWVAVTPSDAIIPTSPNVFQIQAVSLHGKHFLAFPSAVDRLHVWDGTSLRRTGLAQPEFAPTAVTEGVGAYTGTRYFRFRYVERSALGVVKRRSEPSDSVTFTPPGTGAGATITLSGVIGEGETDWEVEASGDDAFYYRIATVAIGTTTYNDTILNSLSYPDNGELSEAIGQYLTIPSVRYLATDDDRLIVAGHWTDLEQQSRVDWTPVGNDPGAGNDERLPLASLDDDFEDLNNYAGGAVSGLAEVVNGSWYAFKWSQIYQAVRTGVATSAYQILKLTDTTGALPNSVVGGLDEAGRACIYYLDPFAGPARLGASGLEYVLGLRETWSRVNLKATDVVCHGVYYPDKKQVKWWVAVDGEDSPGLVLVLQTNEIREGPQGPMGSWTLATGRMAEAYCSTVLNQVVINDEDSSTVTLSKRPYLGLADPDFVLEFDVGRTDNGEEYLAQIITRPYFPTGLLNRWGVMVGSLLALPSDTAKMIITVIRDYGREVSRKFPVSFKPQGTETRVIEDIDNLALSEARSLQFRFADPDPAEDDI